MVSNVMPFCRQVMTCTGAGHRAHDRRYMHFQGETVYEYELLYSLNQYWPALPVTMPKREDNDSKLFGITLGALHPQKQHDKVFSSDL